MPAAMLIGAIRADPAVMAGAAAALLGGIVVWGSNSSTAKEATTEMAVAEGRRAALIETIDLRAMPRLERGNRHQIEKCNRNRDPRCHDAQFAGAGRPAKRSRVQSIRSGTSGESDDVMDT
jgi:hypothetical protein